MFLVFVLVLSSDTTIKEVMVERVSTIIPNNTYLDEGKFLALITGPNMYVPADYAKIPLLDRAKELEYIIVSSQEENSAETKISVQSPIGKSLIGRIVGKIVKVKVQAGVVKYKLLEIRR
jgi:transcription elongation factor GreA